MKTELLILVVLIGVAIGPFLIIYSLNTLFPLLAIPYNIDTWCAAMLIGAAVRGGK